MTSPRLLARLLAIAASGSGCLSDRPLPPDPPLPAPAPFVPATAAASAATSTAATSAPTASAPTASATGASGGVAASAPSGAPGEGDAGEPEKSDQRGPPAAGASGSCADRMACVAGSWCAHLIPGRARGFFGQQSEICRCTASGRFACPAVSRFPETSARVCVPRVAGACPAPDSPAAKAALGARFRVDQCPIFMPRGAATVERDGAGKDECCYTGDFGLCEGRPLFVGGVRRQAARRRGAWG
jgi:hypothetical protein